MVTDEDFYVHMFQVLSEFNFKGVITWLSNQFFFLVYKMIFEQDLPYRSKEAMVALIGITNWYASPSNTFI